MSKEATLTQKVTFTEGERAIIVVFTKGHESCFQMDGIISGVAVRDTQTARELIISFEKRSLNPGAATGALTISSCPPVK